MMVAKRLCPQAIVVRPNFARYRELSDRMFAILDSFSPLVQPMGIDEAFLDLSGTERLKGDAISVAMGIKSRVRSELGLTISVGVSPNKFLAKLASDLENPDGLTVIRPGEGAAFVQTLSIRRFHGIGPVTAAKMEGLGVFSGADLAAKDMGWLADHFGNSAEWLHNLARGIDHRRKLCVQRRQT